MSRTKQIQTRPELPSLDEITSDLESAPIDDVAFTFLRNYTSGTKEPSQVMIQDDVKETAAKRPRQEAVKGSSGSGKAQSAAGGELVRTSSRENSEVQECYQKVQKFLEMNSYMRDSQDQLTQQCSDLQELGQSVKDQIDSLRTQLHT